MCDDNASLSKKTMRHWSTSLEPNNREPYKLDSVPALFSRLRGEQLETFAAGLDKGLHKKLKAGNFLQALQETEA